MRNAVWVGRTGGARPPRAQFPAPSLETSGGRKGIRRGRRTRQPGAAVLPIPRPGRARSPAKSQLVAVRLVAVCKDPMAVWGGRTGGAHAPSRVVASALAGNIGRAERGSTGASNPTAGGGCAPHSKTGTGALPGNVPVGGRAPWWPSARTQWQFGVDERGEHTRPRVWLPAPSLETSGGRKGVRRGRQTRQPGAAVLPSKDPMGGRPQGRCRPAGAEIYFGLGFYKYAAPDGAGERRERWGKTRMAPRKCGDFLDGQPLNNDLDGKP